MSLRSCPGTRLPLFLILACLTPWSSSSTAEETKASSNLLANSGFELGRQFWELGKGGKTVATLDIDGDSTPGGQSALISVGTIDSWGVQFGQNIDGGMVGKTYTFAVMARSEGGPAKISLQIERRAAPYDRACRTENVELNGNEWTELHVTFKLEKAFAEGWFAYLSCTQPNVKFRATQFRLYEGEYVSFKDQHRQDLTVTGVTLFDTAAHSSEALAGDALAKRQGWTQIPEDSTSHAFKGDLVLMNNRLALVLRNGGAGAELYSIEPQRLVMRSVLRPATKDAVTLAGVKIVENSPGSSTVEASFKCADGKLLTMGYAMQMGQAFVQAIPDASTTAVRVAAPSRFAVMPDFFADDMVVDARLLPTDKAELPGDSFLINLLGEGDSILMSVWTNRQEDVIATLSGQGTSRQIEANDIPCGKKDKVWIAVLEPRAGVSLAHARYRIIGRRQNRPAGLDAADEGDVACRLAARGSTGRQLGDDRAAPGGRFPEATTRRRRRNAAARSQTMEHRARHLPLPVLDRQGEPGISSAAQGEPGEGGAV